MTDRSFTEVATEFDRWCQTDITQDEMIDGLIAGSKYLAEQLDESQHTADLRLAEIDRLETALATTTQENTILCQFIPVNEKLLAENGALLTLCERLQAEADAPRWVPWGIVIACCVALYVRLGV